MKRTTGFPRHTSLAAFIAAVLVLVTLSSCEDFFGTADLKESIRQEVVVATADNVPLTVQPDPDVPGGTTSLSTTTQKVGVPFDISATVFAEYAFVGWSEPSGTGAVTFATETEPFTTATITEAADGIVIQANFTRRPELEASDPFNFAESVFKNKTILLYFSKPMDPSTVSFDTISLTHKPYGSSEPAESIADRYHPPAPATGNLLFRLVLKDGETLSETHIVTLRISRTATDEAGNQMAEDATITFIVSNEIDDVPPDWEVTDPFVVQRADGFPFGTGNATNSALLTLRPRAFDNDIVQYLNITEDDDGVTVPAPETQKLYQTAISYTLQTTTQGTKTLSATAQDASSNVSTTSQQFTFIYDTQLPEVPTVTSSPATPTRDPVSFTITAADVGLAGIDEFRVTGGAATSPSSVSGSFAGVTPAAQGNNTITFVAVDNARNIGPAGSATVFYDTVAPVQPTVTVPPSSPSSTAVSLSVSTSDPVPASGVANYRITAGVVDAPVNSVTGSFSNVTPADQGDNTLNIVAVDNAGNTSIVQTQSVFYDSEAPGITGFAVGQSASTDTTTTSQTIRVWANVDEISPPVQAAFSTVDTGPWAFNSFDSGVTTFDLPSTPASYTVYAKFVDALGNETSGTISDMIIFDNLAPNAPGVDSPPVSPTNSSISFTVSASDNGPSGIDEYRVTGGATTTPTSGSGFFSGVIPSNQGTNNITVVAADAAGNVGPSVNVTVVYDTVDPSTPSIDTAPPSLTNGPVTIEVSASDGTTGISTYRITSGVVGAPVVSASGTFNSVTPASQGLNTIYIEAEDGAGNTSSPRATTTVTYDSVAPGAPSFDTPPASPTDSNVSFQVSSVEATSGIDYYRLTGDAAGVPIDSSDGSFSNIALAGQGNNTLTVFAVDNAGNTGASTDRVVVFDTVAPSQPSVVSAPPSPTNSPVTFEVDSTDASSGIDFYRLTGDAVGAPITSGSGTFSNVTPSSQGSNTFSIVAVDNVGLTSSARDITVVYDTQNPNAPSISGAPSGWTNSSVGFTASATDQGDAGIDYYEITGGASGTLTSASGVFSGLTPNSQGSNDITVRAVDNAGNQGPVTTVTVLYDTVAPTISGSLSASGDGSEITGFSVTDTGGGDASGVDTGTYAANNGASFDGSALTSLVTLNDPSSQSYLLSVDDQAGNTGTRNVVHDLNGTYSAYFNP